MADNDLLHIYDLPSATNLSGTDLIPVEQSDGTKSTTKTLLLSDVNSAITTYELKLKSISIPVASVVANTDAVKADFPYCYDYSLSDITANSWADIFPASLSDSSVVDACLEGHNLTSAGTIRIYFFAVPTAVANVTIVYQKGVYA